MGYSVKFQTEEKYKSISYGSNSIYNSACGPASLCNALQVLGIADISIQTMCQLAVSCGARVDGGTVMTTLLQAAAPKYHFTYSTTSKNAELLAHLNAGGVAILHNGNQYKLFSNSGHFVAAVAASGSTITVLDSYWYSGKYTASSIRRNYVSVVEKGVVKTSLTQCGKATIDRSPSYYLISREVISDTKNTDKDVEDMTESDVRKIIAAEAEAQAKKAVSNWATDAWNAAVSAGVLDGTAPQGNLTREQFAVVLRRLGLVGGSDTPSGWAADAWDAATDAGVLDGTNPHGVVTREMLAQTFYALGLLDTVQVDGGTMEAHKSTE